MRIRFGMGRSDPNAANPTRKIRVGKKTIEMERDMANTQGRQGRTGAFPDDAMGRCIGLYRVKQVGEARMPSSHGGIAFPVGRRPGAEDAFGNTPGVPRLFRRARLGGEGR